MSQLFFNSNIAQTIASITEPSLFILVSLSKLSQNDQTKVFDIIRIPNQQLTQDFLDLLKFILPYGLKISGFMFLTDGWSNHISSATKQNFIKLYETISNEFTVIHPKLSFFLFPQIYLAQSNIGGITSETKVYTSKHKITFDQKQGSAIGVCSSLQFKDLSLDLYNNYFWFTVKDYDLSMMIDSYYNLLMNPSLTNLSSKLYIHLKDLNLLIDDSDNSELNEIISKKGVSNFFVNNKEIEVNLYFDSFVNDTEFEETNNTLMSLSSNSGQGLIKVSKLNLMFYASKKDFTFDSQFFGNLKEYFIMMIDSITSLNSGTSYSYSLYLLSKPNGLFYYILYSSKKSGPDEFEDLLYSQRKFYNEAHNFDLEKYPYSLLKVKQLEGFQRGRLEQISKESFRVGIHNPKILLNPHLDLFHSEYQTNFDSYESVKGDYLFFHPLSKNTGRYEVSYCACQTIFSWLVLNGHISVDVPSFNDFQEVILNLGIKSNKELKDDKSLSLDQIGVILSYYLDLEIDIAFFKGRSDFIRNIDIVKKHFENFGTLSLIEAHHTFYSVFSFSADLSKLGLLNHDYTGPDALLSLVKEGNICILI